MGLLGCVLFHEVYLKRSSVHFSLGPNYLLEWTTVRWSTGDCLRWSVLALSWCAARPGSLWFSAWSTSLSPRLLPVNLTTAGGRFLRDTDLQMLYPCCRCSPFSYIRILVLAACVRCHGTRCPLFLLHLLFS
jgi:hypothetical protein